MSWNEMDLKNGTIAVKAARKVIESETDGKNIDIEFPETFAGCSGVFVTIKTYPELELRGCIGFPEPFYSLQDALIYSAQSACHDPRFPDLTHEEADNCVVEVTVLTVPKLIETKDKAKLPELIVIGRDGLMIELGSMRGLLLPQVPIEWGWNVKQYLAQLSLKAGLPIDAWKYEKSMIYSFKGEIFSEKTPKGEIEER
ncbi:MAG: TIGR00296 family protein [Candidatus Methanomethylophilaceae archaeon]